MMNKQKRYAALFLALLTASSLLVSCGKSADSGKNSGKNSSKDSGSDSASDSSAMTETEKKALDLVTLGDYKGIKVTIPSADTATEEDLKTYCDENVLTGENGFARDDTKTVVGENDIVNIDYQGLKDDVAFDGGTATDVYVDVAGNSDAVQGNGYIDGFTSGLIGAAVGSTVDSHVTFPANYGTADLAGAAVIFRFTVHFICTKMTYDTVTDAFVSEKFGCSDVTDFKTNYLKSQYASYISSNKDSLVRQKVMETLVSNAAVDSSVSDSDKEEYVLLAVAAREGLTVDEDGFDSYVQNMMSRFSVTDKDSFYSSVGGEEAVKSYYLATKALQWCVDQADTGE